MSKIDLVSNIYLLLVIISSLTAIFISFAKKHIFEIKSANYWLFGMIILLSLTVLLKTYAHEKLSNGESMVMLLFLLAFIFFHFEYQSLNKSKVDLKTFWIPLLFLFGVSFESLLIQNNNISRNLFVITFCSLNIHSIIYLVFKLRNYYFIFKFCGIIAAVLFLLSIVLLFKNQKTQIYDIIHFETEANAIPWILMCFAQLFMIFNMLLLCLGNIYNKLKQRKLEENRINNIISHDLNSAIGAISSGLDILSKNETKNTALLKSLQKTSTGVQSLLLNVLNWFQKDKVFCKITTNKIDIKNTIDKILHLYNYQILHKDIRIIYRNNGRLIVQTNSFAFETIMRNILSNAIKFSFSKGLIFIDYSIDQSSLFFSVKDFGIGMTKQQVEKLNSVGINISSPGTDGEIGNAIGLNIVRDCIESCAGKIEFHSTQGEGTEVKLNLPIHQTS